MTHINVVIIWKSAKKIKGKMPCWKIKCLYGAFGSTQPEIFKNQMGLDMQRVEGHLSLAEVIKGSRVLLWFAHNGMVKGHSCCIVEKGLRRAREEEGG